MADPNYKKIVDDLKDTLTGEGIKAFRQGAVSNKEGVDIREGVCQGLVIQWLIAKRNNSDFYEKATDRTSLLADRKQLQQATEWQKRYANDSSDRYGLDKPTKKIMEDAGLTSKPFESKGGGALTENTRIIAETVLAAKSRFFILGIWDDDTGHAIGIHRPYGLFAKKTSAYIFDPNVGEFKAEETKGIELCLGSIHKHLYDEDLNDLFQLDCFEK